MKTLKKNYEFRNVLSKGKIFTGKYIKIYIKPNKKQENVIGIAIQTKFGNAVRRNFFKRLIRENYRLIEQRINKGYDIVFLCNNKNALEKIKFEYIKNDMEKIFNLRDK